MKPFLIRLIKEKNWMATDNVGFSWAAEINDFCLIKIITQSECR